MPMLLYGNGMISGATSMPTNVQFGGSVGVTGALNTSSTFATSGALTASSGIAFPATQSSSADANTLDDYEEGTFTPKAGDGTTAMNQVYRAAYTKIGNLVTIDLDVIFPSPNPGTNYYLTGLPFAGASTSGNGGTGMGYSTSGVVTYGHVTGQTTSLYFTSTSGGTLNMAGHRIICSVTYRTT